jgi:hypothetical protein
MFGGIWPESVLRIANEAPHDYETYRELVLSNDAERNSASVMFSCGAEFKLITAERSGNSVIQK